MYQISNPISIIIPFFNEERNIKPLFQKIFQHLKGYDYELIAVNDGSTDETLNQIEQHKNSFTKIINLQSNCGQSAAVKAGIDFSTNNILVILDGDLQNDPTDILKLVEFLESKNLDMVQGYRKNRHDSVQKKIPSYLANSLIKKVFKFPINDIGCALKVFKKSSLKEMQFFDGFHRYLSLLVFLQNFKVSELEVVHHARKFGKSKYGIGRVKKVIFHLWMIKTKQLNKLSIIEYSI